LATSAYQDEAKLRSGKSRQAMNETQQLHFIYDHIIACSSGTCMAPHQKHIRPSKQCQNFYKYTPLFTRTFFTSFHRCITKRKKEKQRLRQGYSYRGSYMHKVLCYNGIQNDENNPAQK
jgi:hypothetical protein